MTHIGQEHALGTGSLFGLGFGRLQLAAVGLDRGIGIFQGGFLRKQFIGLTEQFVLLRSERFFRFFQHLRLKRHFPALKLRFGEQLESAQITFKNLNVHRQQRQSFLKQRLLSGIELVESGEFDDGSHLATMSDHRRDLDKARRSFAQSRGNAQIACWHVGNQDRSFFQNTLACQSLASGKSSN